MRRAARTALGLVRLGLLGLVVLYALFPLYWAIVSSLKGGAALLDPSLVPSNELMTSWSDSEGLPL